MIIPDLDVVACQLGVAGERTQSVVIVIEDRDFHFYVSPNVL
jgi:hypothetical protein